MVKLTLKSETIKGNKSERNSVHYWYVNLDVWKKLTTILGTVAFETFALKNFPPLIIYDTGGLRILAPR